MDKNDFEFHISEVIVIVIAIMLFVFVFVFLFCVWFLSLSLPTLGKALSSAHPVQWNRHAYLLHACIQSLILYNRQFDSKMEDELRLPLLDGL